MSVAAFRRRRLIAAIAVGGMCVCAWVAAQVGLGWIGGGPLTTAGLPSGFRPAATHVWIVRPGDTLWAIAAATGDKGDLRPLVDRLSREVGGKPLQPGERVTLPGS